MCVQLAALGEGLNCQGFGEETSHGPAPSHYSCPAPSDHGMRLSCDPPPQPLKALQLYGHRSTGVLRCIFLVERSGLLDDVQSFRTSGGGKFGSFV